MKYSVCFLFNKDLTKVLLVHKKRSAYAGRLNGVGGKLEGSDENLDVCAVREIREETGINLRMDNLHWLVDCSYPSGVWLGVYYAIGDEDQPKQVEDEQLEWFKVDEVLSSPVNDPRFAGEGNVQYFVHAALCELR